MSSQSNSILMTQAQYPRHLLAVAVRNAGDQPLARRAVREWRRRKGVRGEALDCRVYAFAGLQPLIAMGLSLDRECERIEMMPARAADPQPSRVSYSQWMQG